MYEKQGSNDIYEIRENTWRKATSNRICGMKHGIWQPYFSDLLTEMDKIDPEIQTNNRFEIWEKFFPNGKHLFMTRRNKIRLAVSWWKAIVSKQWHLGKDEKAEITNFNDKYDFNAIHHLVMDAAMRETGIEAFFAEAGIVSMTIVYEDFIRDYEETVRNVLKFLEISDWHQIEIPIPQHQKLADNISEEWVQRFRSEFQRDWKIKGW